MATHDLQRVRRKTNPMIHKHSSKRATPIAAALLVILACLPLLAATPAHAAPVWMERFGSSQGGNSPFSAAVDSHGNIVVAGFIANSDETFSVSTVKYDSAGHQLWSTTEPLDRYVTVADVAVDSNDNVTVVAQSYHYDENDDFFPTTLLLHYSSAGKLYSNIDIDEQTFYGASLLPKIFASPNGDTTIVGSFQLDGGDDEDAGYVLFAERLDSKGNVLWDDEYDPGGEYGDNTPADAAIDPQGNLIVAGTGTSADPSSGFDQATVLKYSVVVQLNRSLQY